jgi:hypothetical protein
MKLEWSKQQISYQPPSNRKECLDAGLISLNPPLPRSFIVGVTTTDHLVSLRTYFGSVHGKYGRMSGAVTLEGCVLYISVMFNDSCIVL